VRLTKAPAKTVEQKHVSIRVKCNVCCRAWTIVYRTQVKKLTTFMMKKLRHILAVKWYTMMLKY